MRIVHLSVVRKLTQGQIKQLRFEYSASSKIKGVEWQTCAFHNGSADEPFIQTIPKLFRPIFMRNLYGWIVAWRLSNTYDLVMMRHMAFDPFSFFFAPFIRNRITVHHAKEIAELRLVRKGWKGQAASMLERYSGRVSVRSAKAVFGVTTEIAEYERDMHAPGKMIGVYSNGVDLSQVKLLSDAREADFVNVAFVCGKFSDWHGLDKLVNSVDGNDFGENNLGLVVHLVGSLSDQQKEYLSGTDKRRKIFKTYGLMSEAEYRTVLEKCDVGVTSLALERKGLREASTLKVREMLAMGLAVYSGHEDMALDKDAPFVKIVNEVDVVELINFSKSAKASSREAVREESACRIDKLAAMEKAIRQISTFYNCSPCKAIL